MNSILSQDIALHLLNIKAVTLSPDKPYTWASGLLSPIYCDNRLTISYPSVRKAITKGFVNIIQTQYPDVDAIVGTATAGIPQACWVADTLNLPTAYVRSQSKGHGKENKIEGVLAPHSKVIVIEDLISTGGSSVEVCNALNACDIEVIAVLSIFTYEMKKARDNFKEISIPFRSLTTFSELVSIASKNNYIDTNQKQLLDQWCENPEKYSDIVKEKQL